MKKLLLIHIEKLSRKLFLSDVFKKPGLIASFLLPVIILYNLNGSQIDDLKTVRSLTSSSKLLS